MTELYFCGIHRRLNGAATELWDGSSRLRTSVSWTVTHRQNYDHRLPTTPLLLRSRAAESRRASQQASEWVKNQPAYIGPEQNCSLCKYARWHSVASYVGPQSNSMQGDWLSETQTSGGFKNKFVSLALRSWASGSEIVVSACTLYNVAGETKFKSHRPLTLNRVL